MPLSNSSIDLHEERETTHFAPDYRQRSARLKVELSSVYTRIERISANHSGDAAALTRQFKINFIEIRIFCRGNSILTRKPAR